MYKLKPFIFLAISLGTDAVNINWANDLPLFQSKYGAPLDPESHLHTDDTICLKRISKPPSYNSVIRWCQTMYSDRKVADQAEVKNDKHDDTCNSTSKLCHNYLFMCFLNCHINRSSFFYKR